MKYKLVEFRGQWCVYWVENGKSKRKSLGTKDRDEALRRFTDFNSAKAADTEFVSGIFNAWKKDKQSLASYETSCMIIDKHLLPWFGHLRPDQINREICRQYTEFKRKELTDWSIRRHLGILRAALMWKDKRTPAVIELPPEGAPRDYYLSRDEFPKALESTETPHIKLFLILALTTAGRMSAILELTWDRVNFERGFIKLATGEHRIKGRATIPMNKRCREALEHAYSLRTCEYVIEYGSKPVKSIKKGIKRVAERSGLNITAHVLRHTSAVWMVQNRIPLETVSKYLGHTSTKVTYQHYAHHSPDYLSEAAEALEF
jgi:integrase